MNRKPERERESARKIVFCVIISYFCLFVSFLIWHVCFSTSTAHVIMAFSNIRITEQQKIYKQFSHLCSYINPFHIIDTSKSSMFWGLIRPTYMHEFHTHSIHVSRMFHKNEIHIYI